MKRFCFLTWVISVCFNFIVLCFKCCYYSSFGKCIQYFQYVCAISSWYLLFFLSIFLAWSFSFVIIFFSPFFIHFVVVVFCVSMFFWCFGWLVWTKLFNVEKDSTWIQHALEKDIHARRLISRNWKRCASTLNKHKWWYMYAFSKCIGLWEDWRRKKNGRK